MNYTKFNSQASMEDMRLSHARFVGCDYGGVSLADSWLTHAQLSGEVPRPGQPAPAPFSPEAPHSTLRGTLFDPRCKTGPTSTTRG